jgi:hypothetical protein
MVELITAAFAPVNVLFTVLLLVLGLYWVMVILGVLDIDLFHIDVLDVGVEADVDVDVDAAMGLEGAGHGPLYAILHFFYIGEIPLMILVSIMVLSLWAFSMLGNYYLNPEGEGSMAVAIAFGNLAISTVVLKFVALPLRRFYILLNKDCNAPPDVVGSTCRVVTTEVTTDRMGQAEVATKGAPILLNVLARSPHIFARGQEAVIVERDDVKGTYLIAPVDLEGRTC